MDIHPDTICKIFALHDLISANPAVTESIKKDYTVKIVSQLADNVPATEQLRLISACRFPRRRTEALTRVINGLRREDALNAGRKTFLATDRCRVKSCGSHTRYTSNASCAGCAGMKNYKQLRDKAFLEAMSKCTASSKSERVRYLLSATKFKKSQIYDLLKRLEEGQLHMEESLEPLFAKYTPMTFSTGDLLTFLQDLEQNTDTWAA